MIRAAGILFLTKDNCALFLKRGAGSDYPGHWCFPGGRQEGGETLEECARREAKEEIGFLPDGLQAPLARKISPPLLQPQPETVSLPTKAEAGYEPTAKGRDHCSGCIHFTAPNGCNRIEPPVSPEGWCKYFESSEEVDFTTYLQRVKEEFTPKINVEHVGYAWAPASEPPQPLHPGCQIALSRLTMDELGIARAISIGDLTSPQRYENIWLFAIRITGTGLSYRHKMEEYVWRDSSIYLNDEFLARCNGLQVILEHPKGAVLNSKEFNDRSIGSVFLPFIPDSNFRGGKPDEVWAVVKIYDEPAAQLMIENQLSTSPSVLFRDPDVNTKVTLEGGESLLIEGKPSLLDHIAAVWNGVWDKGGPPTGVLNQTISDSQPNRIDIALAKMRNIQLDHAFRNLRL